MSDFIPISMTGTNREAEKKRKLRKETCAWQRAAAGMMALNVVFAASFGWVVAQKNVDLADRDARIEQWKTRYNAAAAIERDVVQAYGDLVMQVEAEQAVRDAQAAAYAELDGYRYIGECTITAYCPCEECCGRWADGLTATGLPAGPGIVAVDPEVIPLGSTVIIDGQKYLAADTGVEGLHVDVCLADHAATVEAGVRSAKVWVVADG